MDILGRQIAVVFGIMCLVLILCIARLVELERKEDKERRDAVIAYCMKPGASENMCYRLWRENASVKH